MRCQKVYFADAHLLVGGGVGVGVAIRDALGKGIFITSSLFITELRCFS